jgi:hypothetical protein
MKNPLQRQLLLRSYLLNSDGPHIVRVGQWLVTFAGSYLASLASGGTPYEPRDLFLVDVMLDEWEKEAPMVTKYSELLELALEKQGRITFPLPLSCKTAEAAAVHRHWQEREPSLQWDLEIDRGQWRLIVTSKKRDQVRYEN